MAHSECTPVEQALDAVVKIARRDGGSASGFILRDGLVLTCEHVLGRSYPLRIALRDSRQLAVDVLAAECAVDLAILRPRPEGASLPPGLDLSPVTLAPGQALIAIGHPLGLDWSVTGGHYNATREENDPSLAQVGITLKTPLIQVDVAINAGNSGGPILDTAGRVVGIATSIINPAVANNIGFAIPVETARRLHRAISPKASSAPALEPYSCGHYHPAGLAFCPLLGKPISPAVSPTDEPQKAELPPAPARCTCGYDHFHRQPYCPGCGKPVRRKIP